MFEKFLNKNKKANSLKNELISEGKILKDGEKPKLEKGDLLALIIAEFEIVVPLMVVIVGTMSLIVVFILKVLLRT